MIRTKQELEFYILADRMMNRGVFHYSLLSRIKKIFISDHVMSFLEFMRKAEYYRGKHGIINRLCFYWNLIKYKKLGCKLGFSIGLSTLGYGVSIPHYGTIVVGLGNRIGKYAVLHTSTCITAMGSIIGDGLNLSTRSIITKKVILGNYITICANSVVNTDFLVDNKLIGGGIACCIKDYPEWYVNDGPIYLNRVKRIETLREKMKL